MQDPALLSASLALSGAFCIILMAYVGYLLNRVLGSFLTVIVTYSGFRLLLALVEAELSGFSLFLLMLLVGIIWGYLAYFLLDGKMLLSLLFGVLTHGFVFALLEGVVLFGQSSLIFCFLILVLELISVRVCYKNWAKLNRVFSITFGWYAFCLLFWLGHLVAGPVGILTITLPASLLFWIALLILSGHYVLPIKEGQKAEQLRRKHALPPLINDHVRAMKSVLTFILGSNYPYLVVLDRETVTRVKGNRFKQFFAGPGIILTGPDHVAAIWDGFKVREVAEPGLAFTREFEEIKEDLDLRPQLRAFTVKATTKDGIAVSIFTFVPHRLDPHPRPVVSPHPRPRPELGKSFPYSQTSILKAIRRETVEYQREGQGPNQIEFRKKGPWDTLVPRRAEEILTNIIAEYNFDELCAPYDPTKDPRTEIRNRYITELTEAVAPWGIQVVGGGISNIVPPDEEAWVTDTVWRGRIDNWRTAWTQKMLKELGYGEAAATEAFYRLKGGVYARYVKQLSQTAQQTNVETELISNTLALRIADAVQDMIGNQLVRKALPADVIETLDYVSQSVRGDGSKS